MRDRGSATELNDDYLSTEHLLLALVMADEQAVAGGASCLDGTNREQVLAALAEVRGSHRVTSQNPEEQYQSLEKYGRDLTEVGASRQARPGHRA